MRCWVENSRPYRAEAFMMIRPVYSYRKNCVFSCETASVFSVKTDNTITKRIVFLTAIFASSRQ